jgi:hypothetical protein
MVFRNYKMLRWSATANGMAQLTKTFVLASLAATAWSVVIRSRNWSRDPSLELRLERGVGARVIKVGEASGGAIVGMSGITGEPMESTVRVSASLQRAMSGSGGRRLL